MPVTDNSQVINAKNIPSQDEVIASLPKMLSEKGLCKLLDISTATLKNWIVHRPDLVPRGMNFGSERKRMLRFYVTDVREKLAELRERCKYDPRTPAINRLLEVEIPDDVVPPMPPGVEIVE